MHRKLPRGITLGEHPITGTAEQTIVLVSIVESMPKVARGSA